MKIVTYNINGLRPRVSQFGSLLKLLDSLDSDIICFQETKLSRQDLTADLLIANGYECFFSCTRTSDKGRVSYSGVATFCRVKSAFLSNEVALPVAAEEGFTGVLESLKGSINREDKRPGKAEGLEEFTKEELLKVDSEGRCVITDHGHFVLFNIYAPRAVSDDADRIQFKLAFFKILQVKRNIKFYFQGTYSKSRWGSKKKTFNAVHQEPDCGIKHSGDVVNIFEKRWEFLLHQGRRVFVVGDLNVAPAAIDSCNPGPDFEKNEFRKWFRSMLVENGGNFFDVFRAKHPERKEAYTHFSQNTGAEEFNYGSRIDHILSAGPCLHEDGGRQGHNFVACHVKECDIMTKFKRYRPGSSPRWKGGRNIKLEGSDHLPVYLSLMEIPNILQHGTPSLSARYAPEVRGFQQTIVSVLMKRQVAEQQKTYEVPNSLSDENITNCNIPLLPSGGSYSSNLQPKDIVQRKDENPGGSSVMTTHPNMTASGLDYIDSTPGKDVRKKARQSQWSQLSLKSFFQITSRSGHDDSGTGIPVEETSVSKSNHSLTETLLDDHEPKQSESNDCASTHDQGDPLLGDHEPKQSESSDCASTQDQGDLNACCSSEMENSNVALLEWQRIQQLMQNSIPHCKGHREPCVARVVKKAGPNFGRRFYVCARAEGPASNPETNCGYFKWAASKPKGQR